MSALFTAIGGKLIFRFMNLIKEWIFDLFMNKLRLMVVK